MTQLARVASEGLSEMDGQKLENRNSKIGVVGSLPMRDGKCAQAIEWIEVGGDPVCQSRM